MKTYKIMADFLFADKGFYFNRVMKYEKIDKAIEVNNRVNKTPVFIRSAQTLSGPPNVGP